MWNYHDSLSNVTPLENHGLFYSVSVGEQLCHESPVLHGGIVRALSVKWEENTR